MEANEFLPGEKVVAQQATVRLYDGEDKTTFEGGTLQLTTHRIIWDDEDQEGRVIALDLSLILSVEPIAGTFTKSPKILIQLLKPPTSKPSGPCVLEKASYIRLSFRKGGQQEFFQQLQQQIQAKLWEKALPPSSSKVGMRTGIMGIERSIEKKQQETGKEVSQAFKDLDGLIEKAKDMVTLVNKFAAKLEDKKGSLTEDETIQFKSYLLSVGIANPVTRETHGSGSNYHKELSKQLATFLEVPLKDEGGIMSLADVYCRFNRARGMELVSPDDVVSACKLFETLRLPLRLRVFESGVLVVQSLSHSEEAIVEESQKLVKEHKCLTAEELSKLVGVSIMLAKERLLITEKAGLICRDDTIEGLTFYPNLFLYPESTLEP